MYIPSATYRIQLHKGFNFLQLTEILPYLHDLGVSTIYASPVTQAVPGSKHGYDVINPLEINPEIGTWDEWNSITGFLKESGMGWLQDIVPNHMAYTPDNPWIFDVLERGGGSEFYSFFDIIHQYSEIRIPPANRHPSTRPMLPFLEKELDDCLHEDHITLAFTINGFSIQYKKQTYPVATGSYNWICSVLPDFYRPLLAWSDKTETFGLLPWREWIHFRKRMMAEVWNDPRLKLLANEYCLHINRNHALLKELLGFQHYELCSWETASARINYRRFFTVNSLICLRMEDANTFSNWHSLLMSQYNQQQIQGFRIDHIDGLFDPSGYLNKLRGITGPDAYIITEKILQENETLPPDWPVQGTTGYDFLSWVNQLFTVQEGRKKLEAWFKKQVRDKSYIDWVYDEKKRFLSSAMNGELNNLMRWMEPLIIHRKPTPAVSEIKDALSVLMAAFPVYRIYVSELPLSETDRRWMDRAFQMAGSKAPELQEALNWLKMIFNTNVSHETAKDVLYFLQRWAQYTAPLAAKGTEDTVFYNYNALPGLNEVGDSPGKKKITPEEFHAYMQNRRQETALGMNAGSTHDTKRGEDNRLRINLISLYADEWISQVEKWKQINREFIHEHNNKRSPSANDEYLIYQALLGAIPENLRISIGFRKRFGEYLTKALREERKETNWENPDLQYEKDCHDFLSRILSPAHHFLPDFLPFAGKIVSRANIFSLSQTLLRLTAPGIPDIYQGAELWDLSLVDPDNRLPVDFGLRKEILYSIIQKEQEGDHAVLDYVNRHVGSGTQKIFMIRKLLHLRKKLPDLFNLGDYLPLPATANLIAYGRKYDDQRLIVVAPLPSVTEEESRIELSDIHGRLMNVFTGQWSMAESSMNVQMMLNEFPVIALLRQND